MSAGRVGLWILVAAAAVAISSAIAIGVLIAIPATYFCEPPSHGGREDKRHVVLRWAVLIGKNLAGAVLVIAGVLLSLPGIPGPGLLLLVTGLLMVDIPGK